MRIDDSKTCSTLNYQQVVTFIHSVQCLGMQSFFESPTENQRLLRACSKSYEDQKFVAQDLQLIAHTIVANLVDPLNQCSGSVYSSSFWRRYLSYWMINFIDAVFVEWLDLLLVGPSENEFLNPATSPIRRTTVRMSELLEISQRPDWRSQLKRDIWACMNGATPPQSHDEQKYTSDSATSTRPIKFRKKNLLGTNLLRQQKVILCTTYLPKRYELALGLMLGVVPLRWRDHDYANVQFSSESREKVAWQMQSGDGKTFSSVVLKLLPRYLPWTTVEGMDFLRRSYGESRRVPSVIFTANLHFSSDSFAFWSAFVSERGGKVLVSQHGGLNGQGYIPTRDEDLERSEFDGYLNWGWSDSEKSVRIPAQFNLGRRQFHWGRQERILLMCDSTFRYKRRFWSDSERYRQHLLKTFQGLPIESRSKVLIRLHRDHARYDESHTLFWKQNFPEVEIDSGVKPIKELYRQSRVVLCTTLGTTEIECFFQNQPVLLSLDRTLHRVRPEFESLLGKLEKVGIAHLSHESLARFLDQNLDSLDVWWAGGVVQSVVNEYLNVYGTKSQRLLRDYRDTIARFRKR